MAGSRKGTSNSEWTPDFALCDEAVTLPQLPPMSTFHPYRKHDRSMRCVAYSPFFDPDLSMLASQHERFCTLGVTFVLPGNEAVAISDR